MIGQTCDHRRCSWQPVVIGILDTKCSHRPTEVVRVHGKIGHGVMDIPIFRKTIALTNLASIAVAVRTVMPFDKSGVNRVAHGRGLDSSLHIALTAKDNPQINVDYTTILSCLVYRGIVQSFWWYLIWISRPSRSLGWWRRHRFAVNVKYRCFIGSIFVTSQ